MKILVHTHQLIMSGTVINAIELAAALRNRHGHDVVLFGSPGPLSKLVEQHRLRYIPAPAARFHPTPALIRELRNVVRLEQPDLIHAWDWWQCIDAYCAAHVPMGMPLLVTDMTMVVTRVLPKTLPTTFGTPELVDRARATGRQRVDYLPPPVDTVLNAPTVSGGAAFRAALGITEDQTVLVTVSRLASSLKGDSLLRTVSAMREIGRSAGVVLVLVGDGLLRPRLEALARKVNTELGRTAVIFAGELLDPRPAYAGADIVVGMGSSALRGMAFAKPVIVVGDDGFASQFNPETADWFLYRGMYGVGVGRPSAADLTQALGTLLQRPDQRARLGIFSRDFVDRHFSLEATSQRLHSLVLSAVDHRSPLHVTAIDMVRTASVFIRERRFLTPSCDSSPHPYTEPEAT